MIKEAKKAPEKCDEKGLKNEIIEEIIEDAKKIENNEIKNEIIIEEDGSAEDDDGDSFGEG